MNDAIVSVIGVRISPDVVEPEWHTLWCDPGDGPNFIVTRGGRMQWSSTVEGARALAVHVDRPFSGGGDLESVCDVATTLHDISRKLAGNEVVVLDCLNLLDDMLITVNFPLLKEPKLCLDRVSGRLFEGMPLPEVLEAHGGSKAVLEAVLASLGRVLIWSDLTCG